MSKHYYDVIHPEISSKSDLTSEEFQLCEAYMGKLKDKLDAIDLALPLEDAVAIFAKICRVSDRYSDTTNNWTLVRGEISHADNRLYYGNEG